jgi:hypothetical protein
MGLGVAAFWFPPAFFAAIGLGVAGLVGATTVDATMDGLCDECRQGNRSEQLAICDDSECHDENNCSAEDEWNEFLENARQAEKSESVMPPEKMSEIDDPIACEEKFRLPLGESFLGASFL